MHIVHYISTLQLGGAEALVKEYSLYLNQKHQYTLLVGERQKTKSLHEIQLEAAGVNIVYLLQQPAPKGKKLFSFFKKVKSLKKFLKSHKMEVLHSHLELNTYLFLAKRYLKQVKLFHTVHNEPDKAFDLKSKRLLGEKVVTNYFIHQQGMRLIALHQEMKEQLNQLFKTNTSLVLNNGIDFKRFSLELYQEEGKQLKETLGIQDSDFVIGHIGRFHPSKNHIFLINVFREIFQEMDNAKLLLVGDGCLKEKILALIQEYQLEDKVILLEHRGDIPNLLSLMDVFFFPSIYEGFPVVLIEAQVMKVKCVLSTNINESVHLSHEYYPLSLEAPINTWVETILEKQEPTIPQGDLKEYDMNHILPQLEAIYFS